MHSRQRLQGAGCCLLVALLVACNSLLISCSAHTTHTSSRALAQLGGSAAGAAPAAAPAPLPFANAAAGASPTTASSPSEDDPDPLPAAAGPGRFSASAANSGSDDGDDPVSSGSSAGSAADDDDDYDDDTAVNDNPAAASAVAGSAWRLVTGQLAGSWCSLNPMTDRYPAYCAAGLVSVVPATVQQHASCTTSARRCCTGGGGCRGLKGEHQLQKADLHHIIFIIFSGNQIPPSPSDHP